MSKCHVRELSKVFECLLADARKAFPTLETEFERDLTRLQVLVERRGIRVYLEDLPAVGKHLDRCLAGGQYNLSGLPLTKRFSGRVVIPKFLRGLYLLVFHEHGLLREDYSSDAVIFLRQLLLFAKKATYPCSAKLVEDEVQNFFDTDQSLPEPESYWNANEPSDLVEAPPYQSFGSSVLLRDQIARVEAKHPDLAIFLTVLDSVSNIVTTTLGSYDPSEWRFRHGPGAVAEVCGPSNKYSWKNWSQVLDSEYPIADYGYHNFCSWADACSKGGEVPSQEPTSRLVAVPKTYSGPRLIAAEPSEHQWCQQNAWHYFRSRCRSTWLDRFVRFHAQSLNQDLCTQGSKGGTLATVDLSAASDRVTCHVVGQYFRSNPKLLSCLRASRTRRVRQSLSQRVPEVIDLRKFSTMGNACTFPVESLVFLGIALASVLTTRKLRPSLQNIKSLEGEVAVFGDDIVIPTDSRKLFVEALEVLYFKVNSNKSFWTGRFRESCGVDSFNGVNVTPVYWRTYYDGGPESLASVLECRNNFYSKFLLTAAEYLASTLPGQLPWVDTASGVFGLKTRLHDGNDDLLSRYNPNLQRVEYRVRSIISTQRRTPTQDDTALLQYFTEEPSPMTNWTHGVPQRPRLLTKMRWVAADLLALS